MFNSGIIESQIRIQKYIFLTAKLSNEEIQERNVILDKLGVP